VLVSNGILGERRREPRRGDRAD